jgi:harmonin
MTDCSSYNGSISSDIPSSRGSNSRIRILRLVRATPELNAPLLIDPLEHVTLGFSVRGGREFGTGFFVSHVEKGSEADLKGVRVADQIVRVNGFQVDDATHKELTQYISKQHRLTLKVRGKIFRTSFLYLYSQRCGGDDG